jgi:crossover junction endodeoxyribonuclease RuvC
MIPKNIYIGIDPGNSGAIAAIAGDEIMLCKFTKSTMHDMVDFVQQFDQSNCFALLEKVHAMPKQGVSSTFKFGASFGSCEMLLAATRVSHELITPQAWQKAMECRSGGDKNVTKRKAQQLFPDIKIIHATADAILLAELCRRRKTGLAA